jgi:hypothetical protein
LEGTNGKRDLVWFSSKSDLVWFFSSCKTRPGLIAASVVIALTTSAPMMIRVVT